MHAAQRAAGVLAEQPRGLFDGRRNAGEAGFDGTDRHRQEADAAGQHQHHAGAHQRQAVLAEQGGDSGVEGQCRCQQPDREHRTRQGVAQRGGAGLPARAVGRAARAARGPGDHQAGGHRDHGDAAGQGQRVDEACDQPLRQAGAAVEPLGCFPHQVQRRCGKADQHRQRGRCHGGPAGRAAQAPWLRGVHALRAAEALVPAAVAFQQHQRDHGKQHGAGDLRRAGEVGARDPGGIDRHRERVDAKEFGGADVVECFEQRQAQTHRQRRPCQRQRHAHEGPPAAFAQRARGLHQVRWLRHEHRAGRHVDIGVEHEAEHQDRPRHRAQIGQAELARAVEPQHPANRALHRPDRVQQVQVREGDDVARHRQRQQQRPVQHAPAREVAGGDEPGATGADHQHQRAHAGQQHGGIESRLRQHVLRQMRPVRQVAASRQPQQRDDGCQHAQRDQRRRQAPAWSDGRRSGPAAPAAHVANRARQAGRTGGARAHWSKPTLSTSALACLRYLAISASGSGSTFRSPMVSPMIGSSATPLRTGNS